MSRSTETEYDTKVEAKIPRKVRNERGGYFYESAAKPAKICHTKKEKERGWRREAWGERTWHGNCTLIQEWIKVISRDQIANFIIIPPIMRTMIVYRKLPWLFVDCVLTWCVTTCCITWDTKKSGKCATSFLSTASWPDLYNVRFVASHQTRLGQGGVLQGMCLIILMQVHWRTRSSSYTTPLMNGTACARFGRPEWWLSGS